jgi:4-amino-4-deoxy-L-arabinose transferase-like glycosyltransferase
VAADHYRLPRPVGPSPGIELGAARPSTAEAVREMLRARARSGWLEALALAAVWIVAVGIRLPYLWTVPALTDETDELLRALARAQAGGWLLPGSTVSSVGALHELLFAALYALVGPSPYLPRLVTAIQAALTVPLVYVLTRELCRPLGRRRIEEAFVMPRLAGLIAAGLLATSAAHVVITSHVARSESFTPLLVIALLYAVERALNGKRGRWLVAAGVLFGLALQTSALVLAVLPGLLLAIWWRGRSLLFGRWSVLAALGLAGTYAGVLVSAVQHGLYLGTSATGPWLMAAGQSPSGEMYLDSVGVALVAVWRMLAGQLTSRPPADDVLSDPLAWPFVALAVIGALVLVCRGRPLLPLAALSCLLVLPYVSAEPNPLLNGRYLMPVAVVGIVTIGVAVGALAPIVTGRGSLPRLALGVMLGGLVLVPLGGLRSYYDEATVEERTADGLLRVPRAIFGERRYDEVVLLDDRLARLRLGAGGNALEALKYLLAASSVPTRTTPVTTLTLAADGAGGRALIVLARTSVPAAEASARLTPLLDEWIELDDGSAGLMLFRAESLAPQRLLEDGSLPVYAGAGI